MDCGCVPSASLNTFKSSDMNTFPYGHKGIKFFSFFGNWNQTMSFLHSKEMMPVFWITKQTIRLLFFSLSTYYSMQCFNSYRINRIYKCVNIKHICLRVNSHKVWFSKDKFKFTTTATTLSFFTWKIKLCFQTIIGFYVQYIVL